MRSQRPETHPAGSNGLYPKQTDACQHEKSIRASPRLRRGRPARNIRWTSAKEICEQYKEQLLAPYTARERRWALKNLSGGN